MTEGIVITNAQQLLQEIEAQLGQAVQNEAILERSWIHLGILIIKFRDSEGWRDCGFQSYGNFMNYLKDKYKRGRTQLWSYESICDELLPAGLNAETLEQIGVTKCLELKKAFVRNGRKALPESVIEKAKLPEVTGKELRGEIGKALNSPEDEKGTWFDFDGCYLTKEEKDEFIACVFMTKKLLGISNHIPEHIQRKEIFKAWWSEFFGTHAHDVFGPNHG